MGRSRPDIHEVGVADAVGEEPGHADELLTVPGHGDVLRLFERGPERIRRASVVEVIGGQLCLHHGPVDAFQ
jgi:hypothetical protein